MTGYAALAATLNGQSQQAARAYAGVSKKRETLADLRAQVVQLTIERNEWKMKYHDLLQTFDAINVAYKDLSAGKGLNKRNINGRPVGIASELARTWGVKPDRVCKWVKEGRVSAAGADTRKRALYYLDQSKPAPKTRGRGKSA